MKKTYNTPRCKFLNIESCELLAQSETLTKGTGQAPRVMESNTRTHDIWDE